MGGQINPEVQDMAGCRALTFQEIVDVCAFLGYRDRAWFLLGIATGARINELLRLRVRDVWDGFQVVEYVEMPKSKRGGWGRRRVAVAEHARAALQDWLNRHECVGPGEVLFRSREGNGRAITERQARRLLGEAMGKAGLRGRVATHSMRKTYAQRMHASLGNDVAKTQRALGHANPSSTVLYLAAADEEIDQAARGLFEGEQLEMVYAGGNGRRVVRETTAAGGSRPPSNSF